MSSSEGGRWTDPQSVTYFKFALTGEMDFEFLYYLVWSVIKLKEMVAHVQKAEVFVPTALKQKI